MREIRLWSSPLRARSRTKSEQDVNKLLKTVVKQGRNVSLQRRAYENSRTPAEGETHGAGVNILFQHGTVTIGSPTVRGREGMGIG